MSQLLVTSYGDPRTSVALDRAVPAALGADDILVEMEAAPLNTSDLLLVQGDYGLRPALPSPLGGEGVGRVIDAGGDAGRQLVGRRVVVLPSYEQGTWADHVAVSRRNVVPIREDGDPLQLAMLPINPATAYLLLTRFAELAPGDWVGLNAANSAVGLCVIALARRWGLKTLNVVRREAAAQTVRDAGGDRVIVAGDDLPAQIADALDGAQLGLALDATAGPVVADLAAALRFRGTIVSYAAVTDAPPAVRAHDVIFNEVTHTGFWLLNWLRQAPRTEIEQTYHTLNDLVAGGELAVPVDAVYRLDDYRDAIEHAMAPGRDGKVLFTFT
ncbi:zinc-dependent alcohol dehydrogenase family protein [Dactylosporangium siamense]|uniref:enoyl-[acyl-carrier-protein] reductase n=1 Tax=Dactylosporangium siamense TaxID=685454 RepID=A0A919U9W3_9ACTN|nr:zinc-dependent alcohol dehydrogenase family protein [Dactylosporangium siamense]GIG43781.1 trans-2-enoyl-CoA reductase [Dactylosporangium siamense]